MLEFAVVVPVLMLLAIGAVDFGRAFYTGITVASAVRAGAQFGAQDVLTSTDNPGMIQAARDDAGNAGLAVTPSHFCRCPDGTDPGCSGTCAGYGEPQLFVQVNATDTVSFIIRYLGFPSRMIFRDSAIFRAK